MVRSVLVAQWIPQTCLMLNNANPRPVHTTHFSPHTPQVLSGSDDTTVKLWDLSTQECITTLTPHTDYVRSALFHPTSPHLVLSGSYDSTIRLHDVRLPPQSSTTMTMRHGGAPVEDILAFPTGGVAVSVGGPILRVWDLNMGKCVRALSNHQKTITCAAFDGTKGRVLTGGLDAMVKVYDVEDWKVVHTMRYPAPLLSLAVSVSLRSHIASKVYTLLQNLPEARPSLRSSRADNSPTTRT